MIHEVGPKTISRLIESLPEFEYKDSPEEIHNRIDGKDGRCLTIRVDNQDAGFLVAYSPEKEVYYNWLTGVLPEFRGNQLGRKLITSYENYASQACYKICRVKSTNQFRNMLSLLVHMDYQITNFSKNRIWFEKYLRL